MMSLWRRMGNEVVFGFGEGGGKKILCCRISVIGVGPEREQAIVRHSLV